MKTPRQNLVRATCTWLENALHWDGIADRKGSAYCIQCEVKERAAYNKSSRSRPYSQLQQQKFKAQEKGLPENLRTATAAATATTAAPTNLHLIPTNLLHPPVPKGTFQDPKCITCTPFQPAAG